MTYEPGSSLIQQESVSSETRHRTQDTDSRSLLRARPGIDVGILTFVFEGAGKHLLTCVWVCVCHTHTQTETGGLTIINELSQQCYFRLGHWNNTGLQAQLGQRSDVSLRVVLCFCLLSHTGADIQADKAGSGFNIKNRMRLYRITLCSFG